MWLLHESPQGECPSNQHADRGTGHHQLPEGPAYTLAVTTLSPDLTTTPAEAP
jgi:hypothetical protein